LKEEKKMSESEKLADLRDNDPGMESVPDFARLSRNKRRKFAAAGGMLAIAAAIFLLNFGGNSSSTVELGDTKGAADEIELPRLGSAAGPELKPVLLVLLVLVHTLLG